MKKLLYTLAAVLVCTGAAAQNPTLYFMEGVPLRSQMNPALAPQRGYFNIPVLGGLAVTAGGNTSLDHLLFRRDGRLVTLLSPSVSSADALSDLLRKIWSTPTFGSICSVSALIPPTASTSGRSTSICARAFRRSSPTSCSTSSRRARARRYAIWASVRMPMRKPGSTTRFLSARSSMSVRA